MARGFFDIFICGFLLKGAATAKGWPKLLSSEALSIDSEPCLGLLTGDDLLLTFCHSLIPESQLCCFWLLYADEKIYVDLIFFSLWLPKILVFVIAQGTMINYSLFFFFFGCRFSQ